MSRIAAIFTALAVLSGCSAPATSDALIVAFQTGQLGDSQINEASGLVCPGEVTENLWLHNDGGKGEWLFEAAADGSALRQVHIDGARNRDWEDIGIYRDRGQTRFVVADIGDNDAKRTELQLYIIAADDAATPGALTVLQTVRFRYPGGPRDSEAMAIDSVNRTAWLLSKRTIPAEIYAVPLDNQSDTVVTATMAGLLDTLPQPSPEDVTLAPQREDWFWQPTAMDFSRDGLRAVVLTYEAIYRYSRQAGESWPDAFSRPPVRFPIGKGRVMEALCLDGDAVYMTGESPLAPLFRIPLDDKGWNSP